MPRRSCDLCMRRKTRCDNGLPCRKCTETNPPLECTYLTPVLKRGPKTSKLLRRSNERWDPGGNASERGDTDDAHQVLGPRGRRHLPVDIFTPIIDAYRSRMYPVWPVVDARNLIARLGETSRDDEPDVEAFILATALCSATMAQLNLPPAKHGLDDVDSAYMEKECLRIRSSTNYREHPSVEGVLASFFLHVYHAKADNRNAAMVFLQEAISLARLMRLDAINSDAFQSGSNDIDEQSAHKHLCYVLLWVSERGYAIQHGFPISIQETIKLPVTCFKDYDVYGQGLIELASLFAAFDSQIRRTPRYSTETSPSDRHFLVAIHEALTQNTPRPANYDIVQRADYDFTKQWMRTLLWQQAMSSGLLSSRSDVQSMTFLFPSRIAQDLLASITMLSKDDLLPLGRDQLIKSFEITNTLADVILCAPPESLSLYCQVSFPQSHPPTQRKPKPNGRAQIRECCRYGPPDFLHGLYQTISPFLIHDKRLNDMLRQKAAEALLRAPSRVVPGSIGDANYSEINAGEDDSDENYPEPQLLGNDPMLVSVEDFFS